MRTTLTLDEDVMSQVRQRMHERGVGFKTVVNDLLRRGLQAGSDAQPFASPVYELQVRPDVDLDKALSLAAALEDEETLRKLDVAK